MKIRFGFIPFQYEYQISEDSDWKPLDMTPVKELLTEYEIIYVVFKNDEKMTIINYIEEQENGRDTNRKTGTHPDEG
jgi:hypothetical protein